MCILLFDYEILVQLNPFLIGIGNQTVPSVAGIGIIWDHIYCWSIPTNTKTRQIISELIAVYVKLGRIKSQPLALGALGKQCELWLVDGYL